MKRLILFTLLSAAVVMSAVAQNRSVNFEQTKEWKKIVKKAKKEKKLIFVDCYTSWCGPCKYLAKFIFTNDSVADFFNTNFVNAKFDMEKDADGVVLKKQFGVRVFPTMLFIDPASGEVLHKLVGAGQSEWLIDGGKLAMNPDNNLRGLVKRYTDGERGAGFIRDYADVLFTAYSRDEAVRVACEYLDPLPVDSLVIPENWQMIKRVVSDPLCPLLRRMMVEREKFYAAIGQKEVDAKLEKVINTAVKDLTGWNPYLKGRKPFDDKGNQELIDYLMSVDFYAAPGGLAALYTASYAREKDYCGMLDKMDEVLSYNLFRNGGVQDYIWGTLLSMRYCEDRALIEEGIQRVDRFMDLCTESIGKSNLLKVKVILKKKIGDQAGEVVSNNESEKNLREKLDRKK